MSVLCGMINDNVCGGGKNDEVDGWIRDLAFLNYNINVETNHKVEENLY